MNESTLVPREEISDLDWLARNVHVWPEGKCEVLVRWPHNVDTLIWSSVLSDIGWITKDQWLARRAELQNKPSWKDSPVWAEWLAQDKDKEWKYLGKNPTKYVDGWAADKIKAVRSGEVLGDWRDTLEKRPEQTIADICREVTGENRHEEIFEPFVSVEDAATAKQQAPKGSGNPILGMVLADLTNRALEGKEKYGEPLLAHNGRNPLWDAYQEALDLAMYLRQAIEEQKQ